MLDAVAESLAGFYVGYRDDDCGGPAHNPALMVALIVYT